MVVTNVATVVLGSSKFYTTRALNGFASEASTVQRKAKASATERSKLSLNSHSGKQTHGHDKYGRTRAEVFLPDGMNLNWELPGACGTELCIERYGA
jgi:endonuclease YncB( thermonuclease family)